MVSLTEIQLDGLVEMFNISIGQAAAALSRLGDEEIALSVPSLKFLSLEEATLQLNDIHTKRVCGIVQHFDGPFSTDAILMFPEDRSLEIVRMMLGEPYSMDELSELEQEAMSEIGNIVLNACIGSIANITASEFSSTLPEVKMGTGAEVLHLGVKGPEETVLLVYIDFNILSKTIQGYMAFVMDVPSTQGLIGSLD